MKIINKSAVIELKNTCLLNDYIDIIFKLDSAFKTNEVEEIVLIIDCLGGSVHGLQEVCNMINKIKGDKPVIAYISKVCASAGYYIASACNLILATSSAEIGSVGSFLSLNCENDENVINIRNDEAIFKNPDAPFSDEIISYYKEKVNEYADIFHEQVFNARNFNDEQKAEIKSGKMFTCRKAKSLNLIDEIVDIQDFVKLIQNELN